MRQHAAKYALGDGGASAAGKPLAPGVRRAMEARLGHSFADVRVHSDGGAAGEARALGARAFAVGSDVVFGAGQFALSTARGQALLAHELAHVVQQRGAPTSGPLTVSQPGDSLEREADGVADQIA
jgi:hypothetical protein